MTSSTLVATPAVTRRPRSPAKPTSNKRDLSDCSMSAQPGGSSVSSGRRDESRGGATNHSAQRSSRAPSPRARREYIPRDRGRSRSPARTTIARDTRTALRYPPPLPGRRDESPQPKATLRAAPTTSSENARPNGVQATGKPPSPVHQSRQIKSEASTGLHSVRAATRARSEQPGQSLALTLDELIAMASNTSKEQHEK